MKELLLDNIGKAFAKLGDIATPMVYTETGEKVRDPDTATVTAPSTSYNIKAVPAGYEPGEIEGLIESGDVRIFLENKALPFTPKLGGTVTFNNRTLRVVNSPIEHRAGDVVAFYEIQLRK